MPPRIKDIAGQRFGRLVAIRPTEKRLNNFVVWECKCDCGNIVFKRGTALKTGNTKSCGCLLKESNIKKGIRRRIDMTGQRFGRLVAVKPTSQRKRTGKKKEVIWQCLCDCGRETSATRHSLQRGDKRSCGCLRKGGHRPIKDISGIRYGRLIPKRHTDIRFDGSVVWECQCDCGNTVMASVRELRKKDKLSCGCLYDATRFASGTNINPMDVPVDVVEANKLRIKIKKELRKRKVV